VTISKGDNSNREDLVAFKPKISMITLGVRDMAASLSFYRDGLGFPPHDYIEGQNCVMFKLEGTWLALYPRASLADDASVPLLRLWLSRFCFVAQRWLEGPRGRDFRGRGCGRRDPGEEAATCVLGKLFGLLCRSRRFSVGSRLEPFTDLT
jgi:hypothetical protein